MDTYIESKPSDDQEFYHEVSELAHVCCSCIKGIRCKLSTSEKFAPVAWWAFLAVAIY